MTNAAVAESSLRMTGFFITASSKWIVSTFRTPVREANLDVVDAHIDGNLKKLE
ncbi:hypothetical protein Brsp01_50390 [Brucella sp. NBRC 12950]|nr:hypothetical protein Brsp01_50390 [Brucella sp. NBRC 12950]